MNETFKVGQLVEVPGLPDGCKFVGRVSCNSGAFPGSVVVKVHEDWMPFYFEPRQLAVIAEPPPPKLRAWASLSEVGPAVGHWFRQKDGVTMHRVISASNNPDSLLYFGGCWRSSDELLRDWLHAESLDGPFEICGVAEGDKP